MLEQRAFSRELARHDVEERFALLRRRAFVNDRLRLAIALVQRAGKIDGFAENKPSSLVFSVSLSDPHADHALAKTLGRQGIEIARTAEQRRCSS